MKDEIKEILEDVKRHLDYVEATKQASIRDNEMKAMYDYITNLQEQLHKASLDIQELTERDLMCPTSCDKLINLQEENERLKEENKHIFANVNDDQLLRSNAMNYVELQDYKTRIDKAIEYIKENSYFEGNEIKTMIYQDYSKYILEILQGKSDE